MKQSNITQQNGQAALEACLILPVLICFIGLIFLGFMIFSLRIKLIAITEDLATCHYSQKTTWQCQTQAKISSLQILEQGGLTNATIQTWYLSPYAHMQIQANWGQYHLLWNFKQQSPLSEKLFK